MDIGSSRWLATDDVGVGGGSLTVDWGPPASACQPSTAAAVMTATAVPAMINDELRLLVRADADDMLILQN